MSATDLAHDDDDDDDEDDDDKTAFVGFNPFAALCTYIVVRSPWDLIRCEGTVYFLTSIGLMRYVPMLYSPDK